MALLDLQGMEPSAPEHGGGGGHGGGGVESSVSLLICLASSLSLVTCH
jgi:hypothetical protein